jgi:hypothetical protein
MRPRAPQTPKRHRPRPSASARDDRTRFRAQVNGRDTARERRSPAPASQRRSNHVCGHSTIRMTAGIPTAGGGVSVDEATAVE